MIPSECWPQPMESCVRSHFVEIKLSAALNRRIVQIAEAGLLGRTVDEVICHFTREALHRDWLTQEARCVRVPAPPVPSARPPGTPRTDYEASEYPQRPEICLIRMRDVCNRVGVGRSTIYKLIGLGIFPKPRKLSARAVAWPESEIDAWISSRTSD